MQLHAAQPAIDLTRYQWKRDVGDLTIFGTWLYNEDQEDTEPCLVVIPRFRLNGVKPFVLALSAAFRYNDPRYLARVVATIATGLGFEGSMTKAHQIASVIHDHLPDLLNMPLDPSVAVVVGEASVDLGGQKHTIEVLDYERQKA